MDLNDFISLAGLSAEEVLLRLIGEEGEDVPIMRLARPEELFNEDELQAFYELETTLS